MQNRRYLGTILLQILAAFSFVAATGCGDDGDAKNGGATPTPTTPTPDVPEPPPDKPEPPPEKPKAPPLHNHVTLEDDALAVEALKLLGVASVGGTENCNECHGLTRESLRGWRELTDSSAATCLADLEVATPEAAQATLKCLKAIPDQPKSPFQTSKLGMYATAVYLPWFDFLFEQAYGDGKDTELTSFEERVGMPKGNHTPFTQAEFDIVFEWFERGLPRVDDLLPDIPPPEGCTPSISGDVGAHVAEMKLSGWGAVNAENGILMHGCNGATEPRECLASYPRANERPYGDGWEFLENAKLRVLYEYDYPSAYWTRSSADGRFIAHGTYGEFSAAFLDLQENRVIPADASYDPGFFPDNSGFVFQGSNANFCAQSVLSASPNRITFNEPSCTNNDQVGLYQHVGAALAGGDYWAIDSHFVSDDGGHFTTRGDPEATFAPDSTIKLTPMIYTGSEFVPGESIRVESPFEGDTVISPSSRLLVSRAAGAEGRQAGYILRRLAATPGPSGYTVETPEIARYCVNGGKPGFSYDERWMAIHHYVTKADATALGFSGPDDPDFAQYRSRGASNIYLVDLLTGRVTRVTNMQPGQYALYPHFRSDGWIYFIVRTLGRYEERAIASDAAIVLGSAP